MKICDQEIKGFGVWTIGGKECTDDLGYLPQPLMPEITISFTERDIDNIEGYDFLQLKGKSIVVYPDAGKGTVFHKGIVKDVVKTEDGFDLTFIEDDYL